MPHSLSTSFIRRKCFMLARFVRTVSTAAILIVLTAVVTFAQEFRGSISGRITDLNGAAIANAKVTVTNIATNVASNTTTNENGDFKVLFLTAGSYRILFEANGFKKASQPIIEVRVGDKLDLEIKLETGTPT